MRLVLAVLTIATLTNAVYAQDVKPFVGPNDVRYVYSVSEHPMEFAIGGEKHLGYVVKMWGRAKGTVEAKSVGGTVHYFIITVEGDKIAYAPSPNEGRLWSAKPLQLYVSDSGSAKGWIFVKPPFKGVTTEPPAQAPAPAQPQPQLKAQPPQVMPTNYYTTALYRLERK